MSISSRFDDIFWFWKTPLWSYLARIFLETDVKLVFNHKNRIFGKNHIDLWPVFSSNWVRNDAWRSASRWKVTVFAVVTNLRHALYASRVERQPWFDWQRPRFWKWSVTAIQRWKIQCVRKWKKNRKIFEKFLKIFFFVFSFWNDFLYQK